jgi:hypothetical protein
MYNSSALTLKLFSFEKRVRLESTCRARAAIGTYCSVTKVTAANCLSAVPLMTLSLTHAISLSLRSVLSCGTYCHAVLAKSTDVSEEHAVSIFEVRK